MEFATRAIHFRQPTDPLTGAVTPPIYQTTTFEQVAPGEHRGFDYSRTNNPTRQRLEAVLADLEHGHHAAVFASGLAAEHAVLLAHLTPGTSIVVPHDVYGGTYRLLHRVFEPLGCRVVRADFSDLEALAAAIDATTRLVWLESPTNPRLLVYDIRAVARIAHERQALMVVDNTFATPCFQQPLDLGADLVVHSVTKYLAGHSDVIQGAVIARDAAVFEKVRFLQNALGGVPGAFDCWLTLRGLKTLDLRMERHAGNARRIAEALDAHPRVRRVYYPGLAAHPGHAVAAAQMTGFGGMVAFDLEGTAEEAAQFASSRTFFALAESLGSVRALISVPGLMTHASIPAEIRHAMGLSDTLIRLSPGIEHPRDLVADLVAGLDALTPVAAGRAHAAC
jgi:cystathionine gamma-lyase